MSNPVDEAIIKAGEEVAGAVKDIVNNKGSSLNYWLLIIGFILLIVAMALVLGFGTRMLWKNSANISTCPNITKKKNQQDAANTTATNAIITQRQPLSSVIKDIPENQQVLANFSIMTVYNTGYAGPFQDGVYSEVTSTQLAIKQGARGFFLNIDADETWKPLLVSRNARGYRTNMGSCMMKVNTPVILLGGDPELVLQTIANQVFSNSLGLIANDPVIIYLHFQKTPDPVKQKQDYIVFLSKIANMLMPFRQNHLRMTPLGDFTRQRSAMTIHLNPILEYEKKVLIFTNVDTTVFREKQYPENQDLDYWSHLQIMTNSTKSIGATEKIKDSTLIRGEIETLQYYRQIPPDRVGEIVAQTKISFNISFSQTAALDLSGATTALDRFGVQMAPFDIFNSANAPVAAFYKNTAFRVKPQAIRYTIPAPIAIAQQSPKLNANQGLLVGPAPPVAAQIAPGTGTGIPPAKPSVKTWPQIQQSLGSDAIKCYSATPPAKCEDVVNFTKENPNDSNTAIVKAYCINTGNKFSFCTKILSS